MEISFFFDNVELLYGFYIYGIGIYTHKYIYKLHLVCVVLIDFIVAIQKRLHTNKVQLNGFELKLS